MAQQSSYFPPQSAPSPNHVPPFESEHPHMFASKHATSYIPEPQYPLSEPTHVPNYTPEPQYPAPSKPIQVTHDYVPVPRYPPPSQPIHVNNNLTPGHQHPPPFRPIHIPNSYNSGTQYPPQYKPIHVANNCIPAPQYPPPSEPAHVANSYSPQPQYPRKPKPIHVTNFIPEPQLAHPYAPVFPVANNAPATKPVCIPVPVIGTQFCSPSPVDLAITRKILKVTDGNFVVTDVNDKFMFKVKGSLFSLNDRRVILDAAGKPIVNLRQKIMTAHNRWEVFMGESSEPRDLIFTAKTPRLIQLKTELDVFLAHNKAQLVCDYKVKGSWLERSCIVYAGESSSIVAQMHKEMSVQSIFLGKDKFMVTVYPNIDSAFIVALMVILCNINSQD